MLAAITTSAWAFPALEVLHLLGLPVQVVHAGHDPSFGRDRLRELALAYLERLDDPA